MDILNGCYVLNCVRETKQAFSFDFFFFFTRQKFKVLIAWSLVLYWVFALGNFHNAVPYLSSQYPTLVLVLPYV